jgi:hypothetical protein
MSVSSAFRFISFSLLVVYLVQNLNAQNADSVRNATLHKDFKTEFMWEAKVKIAGMINVGESKRGVSPSLPVVR